MTSKQKIHFEISERKILLRIMDVFFVLGILHLVSTFFKFDYFSINSSSFYWIIVLGFYLNVVGTIFEMYHLQISSNRFAIFRSIVLTTAITTLLYLLTPKFTPTLPSNRLQIIYFFCSILFALLIWRNLYIQFFASHRFVKQVVLVGNSKKIVALAKELTLGNPHFVIKAFVATDDKKHVNKIPEVAWDNLSDYVFDNYISEVVVATESNKAITIEKYEILLNILENGISIKEYADVYEGATYRLPIHFDDKELYKFFPFSRSNQNKLYQLYSRLFDVVFSLVGLLLFSLMLPLIFFCNLIGNKGPLFYKQQRVGKNGIPFNIVKLRTMIANAEKDGAVFAKTNDSRITPFGKLLRKSRLDEVPQFINVLKGEMSIIGPRPERPVFVEQIAENIPLYKTRHVIKPGLTGWAQVNYPYGENLEDSLIKLRYDLYYIKHRSLFLDVNIIIKTLSTVLFFRGQ